MSRDTNEWVCVERKGRLQMKFSSIKQKARERTKESDIARGNDRQEDIVVKANRRYDFTLKECSFKSFMSGRKFGLILSENSENVYSLSPKLLTLGGLKPGWELPLWFRKSIQKNT